MLFSGCGICRRILTGLAFKTVDGTSSGDLVSFNWAVMLVSWIMFAILCFFVQILCSILENLEQIHENQSSQTHMPITLFPYVDKVSASSMARNSWICGKCGSENNRLNSLGAETKKCSVCGKPKHELPVFTVSCNAEAESLKETN